jgi:hypothetical protein
MRKFLAAAAAVTVLVPAGAQANDYSDSAYRSRDQKNFTDSCPRFTRYMTPQHQQAAIEEYATHRPDQLQRQAQDPTHPAGSLGSVPTWDTGEIPTWRSYRELRAANLVQPVSFRARTGAVLRGHVWRPATEGVFPVVSITPGSVQATEADYYWAGTALSRAGYVVLTFDAQGQGQSGTFGNEDLGPAERPTTEGVPFQQDVNFLHATIDAISFVLARPERPHSYAFARDAASGIDVVNPYWSQIEYLADGRANLGLAGHSYGAQGVSFAQDPTRNTENVGHIRTIVAWDNLSASYTPNVPAMGQNGESFVTPSFNYSRPNPEGKKGAFNKWRTAGVDTMQIAPLAATHMEWGFHPPACGSNWGNAIATYYTLAWFDKYLKQDPTADARLLTKQYLTPSNPRCGNNANCYSIYYKSAYAFRDADGVLRSCDDMAHIANKTPCPDTDL